jgi:hypothetical protein
MIILDLQGRSLDKINLSKMNYSDEKLTNKDQLVIANKLIKIINEYENEERSFFFMWKKLFMILYIIIREYGKENNISRGNMKIHAHEMTFWFNSVTEIEWFPPIKQKKDLVC